MLEAVRAHPRGRATLPLLLFSYFNPLLRYGLDAAGARRGGDAGVDGVLVTDLPPEEADEWLAWRAAAALDTVFLAAPTSPDERLRRVAEASRGFVYAVSRTGVTGEQRRALGRRAAAGASACARLTDEPVALGFGISTPEQVAAAAAVADGVVVGSALVRFLEEEPAGRRGGEGAMAEERDVSRARAGPGARRRIDAVARSASTVIDTQLMGLLNSRSACAVEIGRIKRRLGLPVYSPEREAWPSWSA